MPFRFSSPCKKLGYPCPKDCCDLMNNLLTIRGTDWPVLLIEKKTRNDFPFVLMLSTKSCKSSIWLFEKVLQVWLTWLKRYSVSKKNNFYFIRIMWLNAINVVSATFGDLKNMTLLIYQKKRGKNINLCIACGWTICWVLLKCLKLHLFRSARNFHCFLDLFLICFAMKLAFLFLNELSLEIGSGL